MGYKFEVSVWERTSSQYSDYGYTSIYFGQSLIKALWVMWRLKKSKYNCGCVKLEWR